MKLLRAPVHVDVVLLAWSRKLIDTFPSLRSAV